MQKDKQKNHLFNQPIDVWFAYFKITTCDVTDILCYTVTLKKLVTVKLS